MSATSQPVSHGVRARVAHPREWGGVHAEAVEWHCGGLSFFDLTSERFRVGFVLEQSGGRCEVRTNPARSTGYPHSGRPFLSICPPRMPTWACSEGIRYTRSLALKFDAATVVARLGEDLPGGRELAPHLNFEHGRLSLLADILANECRSPGPFGELYGDSLITAILVELARAEKVSRTQAPALHLAPWQLRRALDFMEERIAGRVLLRDLAQLTGLSQSYFGRAFKASTGMPPYQWFLGARIRRAQWLLLDGRRSIADIATAVGFADQAHFSRAFARATGTGPAAWRRNRR